MARRDLDYFTCTLGEAARWNKEHPNDYHTVNDLVDILAEQYPQDLAFSFADYRTAAEPDAVVYSFQQLRAVSCRAAESLARLLRDTNVAKDQTIGLLSQSNASFVWTWLGLMRLGHSVLLLAPQLDLSSIRHLCTSCHVQLVLCDEQQLEKLRNLNEPMFTARGIQSLGYSSSISHDFTLTTVNRDPSDIAYLFHTSGTSSGRPKPIPQSHYGAVGVLPRLPAGRENATFSTTPLYHGGISDCLRAWSSGAMIWLFPEGQLPITALNVQKCLDFADKHASARIAYFTSVPYILQALAEDPTCLLRLQTMDQVGVGGAAMLELTGNKLVDSGMRLVSRYGSAECGFLMSSFRDYKTDKEWQYLRMTTPEHFIMEPRGENLSELIVKASWPHLSKTNREDGSYATSDLLEPHPRIPNAWRYHSRADAQITLTNGKKFDPTPLEATILASSQHILEEVLIFGTGKEYPGILLFPKTNLSVSPEAIKELAWPIIASLNAENQRHAQISKTMVIVIAGATSAQDSDRPPLEKSSKGTILRSRAEERYGAEIGASYNYDGNKTASSKDIPDDAIHAALLEIFMDVLGRSVDPTKDLFQQGVDSIACIQVRHIVNATILQSSQQMPFNTIYDQGNIDRLAKFIVSYRGGHEIAETESTILQIMENIAQEYSTFTAPRVLRNSSQTAGEVVVLTGATGALGAHILHLLRKNGNTRTVYCLVRAETHENAHQRVSEALQAKRLPALPPNGSSQDSGHQTRIVCLPCQLTQTRFGLSNQDWSEIITEPTTIIHAAWAVNFSLQLPSLVDHILGTRYILELAMKSGAQMLFISSAASVSSSSARPILEIPSLKPSDASPLGYSQSKWVAERMCQAAHDQVCAVSDLGFSVSILRVGQLCGNEQGVWNANEAYPLLLSTARLAKCLPELPNEALSWLPVDKAAQVVLDIAKHQRLAYTTTSQDGVPVFHILNQHNRPTWLDMLRWIQDEIKTASAGQEKIDIVSPSTWLQRLDKACETLPTSKPHPARALRHFWQHAYCPDKQNATQDNGGSQQGQGEGLPVFDTKHTKQASTTSRALKPLDKEAVLKMWMWIRHNVGV